MANEDKEMSQERRNIQNNSNNIRNAADVAIATKNPYAMAAGESVKVADKITGGKSTEKLGKVMNTANKISPGGRKIQGISNQLSESGVSDKIGKVASAKNSINSTGQNFSNTGASNNMANNMKSNITSDDNFSDESLEEFERDKNKLLGEGSSKIKFISFGVIGFLLFLMFFIVIIFAPVAIVLDIIDVDIGSSSSSGYAYGDYISTTTNTGYWWPIGGEETTTIDGKTFAYGDSISSFITSDFGYRESPIYGGEEFHNGIDISSNAGGLGTINIIAIKDGTVIYPGEGNPTDCPYSGGASSCGGGFGNYVMIDHGDGLISLYGHMHENTVTVKSGDTVKQGQVIGKMGSSGSSDGMHLHFTIKSGGNAVNPLEYVSMAEPRPGRVVKNNRGTEELQ